MNNRKTKQWLAVLLAAMLLFASLPSIPAAASTSDPIFSEVPLGLVNGDFEGAIQNGRPEGWKYWRHGVGAGMSVSEAVYKTGKKSMRLDVFDGRDVAVESTPVAVEEGAIVKASASVFVENITASSGGPGGNINFWIRFFTSEDLANPIVGTDVKTVVKGSDVKKNEWFDISVQAAVPAGAKYAIIFTYVYRDTSFTGYYDDARFVKLIANAPNEPNDNYEDLSVTNPGFEEGLGGGGRPAGWIYWKSGHAVGMSVTNQVYRSGNYSMRLNVASDKYVGIESTPVGITEGDKLRFSAYIRVANINDTGIINFTLRFVKSDLSVVKSESKNVTAAEIAKNEWMKVTFEVVAPAGAQKVIIFPISKYNTLDAYFDDIKLQKYVEPPAPTVPHNGGFELPLFAGLITGWTTSPNPPNVNTSATLSQERAASGKNSLKLVDNNSSSSLSVMSEMLPVEPGKGYDASSKVFIESGAAAIYLKYYDASNKEIGTNSQCNSSAFRKWIQLRAEDIAPQRAVKARVLLYSGVAATGTVACYDDVAFTEIPVLNMPYEFGKPVSLGTATAVAQTGGASIGNGEIYFGASGTPATFYAIDALTGEIIYSEPFKNDNVVWATTVGADGNAYLAGTNSGELVRYNRSLKKLEYLGANPSNRWVWDLDASPDGKIYGSTYPSSKAFVYDIATGTFTDYGTLKQGQDYVRGGGVSGNYFYAGIGTTAYLYRIDRTTGEKTEINLPITGAETTISNVVAYSGKLFVVYGTSMLILDEATYTVLKKMDWQDPNAFDGAISPPSPYDPNLIYFRNKNNSKLWTYNMLTNETAPVTIHTSLPNMGSKALNWVQIKEGPNAGRQVLAIVTGEADLSIYDPIDQTLVVRKLNVAKSGIELQSIEASEDGKLYMGGYQGAMSIYDAVKGKFTLQEKDPSQIEGIGFLNGKVYLGIYGGAVIWQYDPTKPYEIGKNPYIFYDIQDGQSRPFTFASGENKLFVGTISDYGQLGGALSIFDEASGAWSVHRNVVENQSVIGLAYHKGKVYGGTTLSGGLGIDPVATVAKMFVWDVAANSKVAEFVPAVPGFTPKMIGELTIGSDGYLYGAMWGYTDLSADAYSIFVMNPETKQIVRSTILTSGATGSTWRPFFLAGAEMDCCIQRWAAS